MIFSKLLYKYVRYPLYKHKFGSFGFQSQISKFMRVENPKNIYIGQRVAIGSYGWLAANPLTGFVNCKLEIGDDTYIGNSSHIYCTKSIIIENSVLIADKVYISDNQHQYKNVDIPVLRQPIGSPAKIIKRYSFDKKEWLKTDDKGNFIEI